MTFLITSDQLSTVEDDCVSYSKYKIIFSHYSEDLMLVVSLEMTYTILNSLKNMCVYIYLTFYLSLWKLLVSCLDRHLYYFEVSVLQASEII